VDGLKQRVIGALVLVSLAVIFVPMLFDEPHSERTSTTIKLPEEPPFPEVEAPEPVSIEAPSYHIEESAGGSAPVLEQPDPATEVAPAMQGEAAPAIEQPAAAAEPAAPKPEPAPREQPRTQESTPPTSTPAPAESTASAEYTRSLAGAWVVQLGSFGNADNARRLRDDVRERGYNSHLQEVVRGEQTLVRVFSGPFAEKAEAERAKQVLDKAFGLNSLVTSGDK